MARLFDDGASEYLEFSGAVPVTAAPFTVVCRFKSDDATNSGVPFWLGDKDVDGDWWALNDKGDAGDVGRLVVYDESLAAPASTNTYTQDVWGTLVGREYSATAHEAILNGDLASKGTDATNLSPDGADRMAIGRAADSSPSSYFSGAICEVALWNRALSDEEVTAYAAGFSPLFFPAGLQCYWPLGGLYGNHDRDIWGGYDMAAHNTPSWTDHPGGLIYPSSPIVVPFSGGGASGGAIAGNTAIALMPAGIISGIGFLTGSTSAAFAPTGTAGAGGILAGSAAANFTSSGAITAGGTLAGSAVVALAATGVIGGGQEVAGSTAAAFTAAGTISGKGSLAGSAAIAYTPAGDLDTAGTLSGSAAVGFSPAGTIGGEGVLAGSLAVVFSPGGDLLGGMIAGAAACTFTAAGFSHKVQSDPYQVVAGQFHCAGAAAGQFGEAG